MLHRYVLNEWKSHLLVFIYYTKCSSGIWVSSVAPAFDSLIEAVARRNCCFWVRLFVPALHNICRAHIINTHIIHIMRPRFLGDQPPTAQFLNDITQVLSLKLTCVRLLLLTKAFCAGIVSSSSLGEDAREEKENADAPPPKPPPLTLKDLTDETTSRETIEICTSLIETIVRGAVRYELDANELRNELEQLGLPKVSFTLHRVFKRINDIFL